MPGVTTSSPAVMLARLTAHTERIRLGFGGVMLPNHAPLVIAEQYGMLDALAPGRIDLGLGLTQRGNVSGLTPRSSATRSKPMRGKNYEANQASP